MATKKKANSKKPFAGIKKGALRAKLGTPKGKNISVADLNKAAKSKNPLTRKQAVLAKNFRKMNKRKA